MTIIAFNRYWVMRWPWVLVSLMSAAFLMSLSFWQWSRASEKLGILARIDHWHSQGPINAQQLLDEAEANIDGRPIAFQAYWQPPKVWLLDNQLVNGRIGYDVIIAAVAEDGGVPFLVNLGWVAAPPSREQLPQVEIPPVLEVNGIFRTHTTGLLLGTNLEDTGKWPMRMQQLDARVLTPYVDKLFTKGVIYQLQDSPFLPHYQAVILPPERHRAYALQWALLAVAVIAVALAASATKELPNDQS